MRTLYLVCGAPFSGKTTLAKHIAERTHSHYISLDDLMRARGLDLSQSQPVEEWEKAHHQCIQLLHTLMKQGINVVLDDTLFLKWLRDRYRNVALEHQYQVVTVYLAIPLAELEKRNQQFTRRGENGVKEQHMAYIPFSLTSEKKCSRISM